jgi:hypothetical protein
LTKKNSKREGCLQPCKKKVCFCQEKNIPAQKGVSCPAAARKARKKIPAEVSVKCPARKGQEKKFQQKRMSHTLRAFCQEKKNSSKKGFLTTRKVSAT